jgi:signal transduction histidine kinase/ligand-binding sensor domain-containing protein
MESGRPKPPSGAGRELALAALRELPEAGCAPDLREAVRFWIQLLFGLRRPALCGAAMACASVAAFAEPPIATDYVLRVWELEDGMPDHHVGSLARGADGYLWLTTFGGLARFDGLRFERMGKAEVPGLTTPWVAPVHVARDQTLWLGLERGGVVRWKREGVAQEILPVQPRAAQALWPTSFAEDRDGAVWFGFGHEAKVFRWRAGELRAFTPSEGVPPGNWARVVASARGEIWCATQAGCARFDGERFVAVDIAWEKRMRLAASASGGMWAAGDAQLFKYSDTGEKSFVTKWDLPSEIVVEQLLEDREGRLWIGTWGAGLYVYDDGRLERVPTSFGQIPVLHLDDEGTLWVGTWGGGLERITPRRFFLHGTGRGSGEDGTASIATDGHGRRWMVDRHGVPAVGESRGTAWFSTPSGWPADRYARVVCVDRAGEVWLGTDTGLLRRRGDGFVEEAPREAVSALFCDGADGVWVATARGGVHRRGPEGSRPMTFDRPLREVRVMTRDAVGRMWFGTRDGSVFYAVGDRLHPVALPGAGGEETVRHLVPDGDDVWIGTLLGGLYRWRAGEVTRLPTDPDLPLGEFRVLHIQRNEKAIALEAGAGDDVFWFGTAQGLFSTTRREIERRLGRSGLPIGARWHGSNDGLPAFEFVEGGFGGVSVGLDGRPWFATNRGALEIRAGEEVAHRSTTTRFAERRVLIEAAELGEQELPPVDAGGWKLPPRPGPLRIRYTLPELREPEQVRFRHRLLHFGDEEWSQAGPAREAVFLGLAPGSYRFEVAASVGGDAWLAGVAAAEFSVEAMWWQRVPFRMFALGALAAAVWGGVTLRARTRIRRAEQAQAVERERTRIARDMHDELGASLTQIGAASSLAQGEPPESAAARLREIGDTARRSVEALDEIVWAVNPRYDSLAGTIEYLGKYAVRFLSSAGVARELDLPAEPPDLPMAADRRHHLLLVVKEALNNAVKHARPALVRFTAAVEPGLLRVSVEDDGAGFDPKRVEGFSNGLRNMRERMAAAGGRLVLERAAGGGTRVVAELPLPMSPARESSGGGGLTRGDDTAAARII